MLKWKNYLAKIRATLDIFAVEAQNSVCFDRSSYTELINEQKIKLLYIFESFDTPYEEEAIQDYIDFCIHNDLPYFFIINELSTIAKNILGLLASETKCSSIVYANNHFDHLETKISEGYYQLYLRKLSAKNHLRLSHLSHLIEKHLMLHYQHHLEWMLVLIAQLQGTAREHSTCQLDHNLCSFGQWLHNPSLPYLSSTSHFNDIQNLHIELHQVASDIMSQHHSEAICYKSIFQLLQRLDYLSLEIGNEIAIINDMIIIGEYSKDPMTGLLGRRQFEKIMMGQIEIAKATENECAMFMCDLDHFKEINDTHSHLAGDEVIKNFASVLQNSLRKSDFMFRFGGEEFIILLPSTSYKQAYELAQHICDKCAMEKVMYEGSEITYTVSIGVCKLDTSDLTFVTKETIQHYVQTADAKLYLAKHNGRNRVE